MINKIKNLLLQPIKNFFNKFRIPLTAIQDMLVVQQFKKDLENPKNPLNKYGKKCFSQTDEDGITLEIVKRMKIDKGIFCEIGCGNGLENNTLILAAAGWRGTWFDTRDLAFNYKENKRFKFIKQFIDNDNILQSMDIGFKKFNNKEIDLLSIDTDGNDLYFVEHLLKNSIMPKIVIVEINAKYPPPIEFKIDYANRFEEINDYYGASLSSFNSIFSKYKYKLVCCTLMRGHNAFFVREDYINLFNDVPDDINQIYNIPNFWGHTWNFGPKVSNKTVEKILRD